MKSFYTILLVVVSLGFLPNCKAAHGPAEVQQSHSDEKQGMVHHPMGEMMDMMQSMHDDMGSMMKDMTDPMMKERMQKMQEKMGALMENMGEMLKKMRDKGTMYTPGGI